MYVTGSDPGVVELAAIFAEIEYLGERIEDFLAAHPEGHRCPCCREVDGRRYDYPGIRVVLASLRLSCWSAHICEDGRPMSTAEWEHFGDSDGARAAAREAGRKGVPA